MALGIFHLVHAQNFVKNYHSLPPDTHTNVSLSVGNKSHPILESRLSLERFILALIKQVT